MTLRLNSTGGGYIEIDAPNTASNFSVTMPAAAGDVVVADASGDIQTTRTGTGGSSGEAKVVGYQQGEWTAAIFSTTNMGNTFSNVDCRWTRQGNMVTLWFGMTCNSATGNTAIADEVRFNGVPYRISNDFQNAGPFLVSQSSSRTVNGHWYVVPFWDNAQSDTFLIMRCFALVGTVPRTTPIKGSVTYITDDTTWTPANAATVS